MKTNTIASAISGLKNWFSSLRKAEDRIEPGRSSHADAFEQPQKAKVTNNKHRAAAVSTCAPQPQNPEKASNKNSAMTGLIEAVDKLEKSINSQRPGWDLNGSSEKESDLLHRIEMLEEQMKHMVVDGQMKSLQLACAVTDYTPVRLIGSDAQHNLHVALRSFFRGGQSFLWTVNVHSLQTQIVPRQSFRGPSKNTNLHELHHSDEHERQPWPYSSLLAETTAQGRPLQMSELIQGGAAQRDPMLAIDLSLSQKALNSKSLIILQRRAKHNLKPVPLALCVSGLAAHKHSALLQSFAKQQNSGIFNVVWVHQFSGENFHLKNALPPCHPNFSFAHRQFEIFEAEKILIEHGLCPSIFYRLPSPSADQEFLDALGAYGLVALSAKDLLDEKEIWQRIDTISWQMDGKKNVHTSQTVLIGSETQKTVPRSLEEEAQRYALALNNL